MHNILVDPSYSGIVVVFFAHSSSKSIIRQFSLSIKRTLADIQIKHSPSVMVEDSDKYSLSNRKLLQIL